MDYFPFDIKLPGTIILDKLAQNIHGGESLVFSSISPLQAHYYQQHAVACLL